MFNFGNKSKNSGGNSKSASNNGGGYSCKKLFPISKPWGYSPKEVDDTMGEFTTLMVKQKNIIIKMKNENESLRNEIENLKRELQNMQLELSFSTIPSVNDIQEKEIISKFEQNFSDQSTPPEPAPVKKVNIAQPQPVQQTRPMQEDTIDIPITSESLSELDNEISSMIEGIESGTSSTADTFDIEMFAPKTQPRPQTTQQVAQRPVAQQTVPSQPNIPQQKPVTNNTTSGGDDADSFFANFKF